jgi:hypothetical protein
MFGVKVVSRDASNIGVCPNAYIPGTQAYGKNGIYIVGQSQDSMVLK